MLTLAASSVLADYNSTLSRQSGDLHAGSQRQQSD
jgi:hypothetical protein